MQDRVTTAILTIGPAASTPSRFAGDFGVRGTCFPASDHLRFSFLQRPRRSWLQVCNSPAVCSCPQLPPSLLGVFPPRNLVRGVLSDFRITCTSCMIATLLHSLSSLTSSFTESTPLLPSISSSITLAACQSHASDFPTQPETNSLLHLRRFRRQICPA